MKAQSSYELIYIGLLIRLLRNISENVRVFFAKKNIDMLEDKLEKGGFIVSVAGLNKMREYSDDLKELDE